MSNSQARGQQRQVRPRRRNWGVLFGFGCLLAPLILLPMIFGKYLTTWIDRSPSTGEAQTVNLSESGTGTVVVQTPKQSCTLMKFDNRTGRTIENERHCENTTTLDAQGIPVPEGTIHRLDSISKSFLGEKR